MSVSLNIIDYNDLPKNIHFTKEGAPKIHEGKKYQVMTGEEKFSGLSMMIKLIKAFIYTLFSAGFGLIFKHVRDLWKEGYWGNRIVTVNVAINGSMPVESASIGLSLPSYSIHLLDIGPRLAALKKERGRKSDTNEIQKIIEKEEKLLTGFIQQNREMIESVTIEDPFPGDIKNDRQAVSYAIKENPFLLAFASETLRSDRSLVLESLKGDPAAFMCASESLRDDQDFYFETQQQFPHPFSARYLSNRLKGNKDFIFAAFQKFQHLRPLMQYASETIKKDVEFICKVVDIKGGLYYVIGEISENQEIKDALFKKYKGLYEDYWGLIKALGTRPIKIDYKCLQNVSHSLRNNREMMLGLAEKYGKEILKYASEELLDDNDFIASAIEKFPHALKFASKRLRGDREMVLKALKPKSGAFKHATEELRNDEAFLFEAMAKDYRSFEYATDSLKGNKDTLRKLQDSHLHVLSYAPHSIRNDAEFMLEMIKRNDVVYHSLSDELKNDGNFFLRVYDAVKEPMGGIIFGWAGIGVRGNRDIFLKVIKEDFCAFEYGTKELMEDRELWREAIKTNPTLMRTAPEAYRKDKDFIVSFVEGKMYKDISSSFFQYVDESIRGDKETMLHLIKFDRFLFQWITDTLKNDKEFVRAAFAVNQEIFNYLPYEFRDDETMAFAAVTKSSHFINDVSERLKDSQDFIRKLFSIDLFHFFNKASVRLRTDQDFIFEFGNNLIRLDTIPNCSWSTWELTNSRDFIRKAVGIWLEEYTLASDEIKQDRVFNLELVGLHPKIYRFLTPEMREDREITLTALRIKDPSFPIELIPEKFFDDEEVIFEACKHSVDKVLTSISEGQKSNKTLFDRLVGTYGSGVMKFASEGLL